MFILASDFFEKDKTHVVCTVGENIIATTKKRNN